MSTLRRKIIGYFLIFVAAILAVYWIVSVGAEMKSAPAAKTDAGQPMDKRADVKLLNCLTACVDYDHGSIDAGLLKTVFLPRLDLGTDGKAIYATSGINTDGRFLLFHVRKTSRSGKTTGYFQIAFFVEKHDGTSRDPSVLWKVYFRSALGKASGNLKKDRSGVIDIYDIVLGDYLVNDANGNVIKSLNLPAEEFWSPKYSTSNLVNAGKSVGQIIGEHLETLERTGKGGREYSEQSAKWFSDQKREDEKAQRSMIKF